MLLQLLIFVVSLAVLIKGSDWFIESAERIGLAWKIPSFVIGLTIVAFGTSLPELATSIAGVVQGAPEVVFGNVIGSNITNILLIVGLVAVIIKRLPLRAGILDTDIPMLLLSAFFLYFVLQDGQFSIPEACLSLVAITIFTFLMINSREEEQANDAVFRWRDLFLLIIGGVAVVLGARFSIEALLELATMLQVGTDLLAATVVALGTSLPELAVSIAAARRNRMEIAVGNVIGSNIFNTYMVMAIPRFFGEMPVQGTLLNFSLPFMVGISVLFAFLCLSKQISRYEGGLLLVFYAYFLIQSITDAM